MKRVTRLVQRVGLFLLSATNIFATPGISSLAPQPTTCITSVFSSVGDSHWQNITLKLTNNCNQVVDFQNAVITFKNKIALNTSFWGDFGPLSYPDNQLKITSQQIEDYYLSTLNLHFPSYPGANSKLPAGSAIKIQYGAKSEGHIGEANVYLSAPIAVGNIELTNASGKPTNVSQTYALIHVTANGQTISDVQLPWNGMQTLVGLSSGSYNISADQIVDANGTVYQGTATPSQVSVVSGQTVKSTITYNMVQQTGKVVIQLQQLPDELFGYSNNPTVQVTEVGASGSASVAVNWGESTTVANLKNGKTYAFSTANINYNGYNCEAVFTPESLVASENSEPTTNLTYTCTQTPQSLVTLSVNGAPANLSSLKITLMPNNNTAPVIHTIDLNNGSGSSNISLITGVVYNVSSDPVTGYTINFDPQPLVATDNATEIITLTEQTNSTPVGLNGQLSVCGTKLCNEHDQPIQLRGMSSHGIQWYGWQGSKTSKVCLTTASLDTMVNWGASVMRIAMYVQEGGYETDPVAFTKQVNDLIDEATKRGVYVIVDWHILSPGNPNHNLERAKTFFTAIANAHKNNNNLLYEIANEPNGVSWSTIKSYADALIPVIRAVDPKTVIIVGTPGWSSLGVSDGRTSQDIINAPVNFSNIMYAFHFYAASHKDTYYAELDRASDVLPIFVTEFGTQTYSGDGANDFVMSDRYMQLMATKKISWSNWNYSDDFRSGAIWKTGTCPGGAWTDSNLKPAGVYIKAKIGG
ncbi:chitinase [Legionella lansingensis]|uniref:Chitinase n=1 Tax=Legionella lansingensis TaxID=45067 RepID=A0A0W0VL24_9GAMM|nr:glycoside hydrolase family 5 protein [Legionella lansingensis]KTD20798.1 chitinase [Legionella lansingensis]SNV49872.1 chitinase [Legionella lansingensis]